LQAARPSSSAFESGDRTCFVLRLICMATQSLLRLNLNCKQKSKNSPIFFHW
jgi:hypothetical protein